MLSAARVNVSDMIAIIIFMCFQSPNWAKKSINVALSFDSLHIALDFAYIHFIIYTQTYTHTKYINTGTKTIQ